MTMETGFWLRWVKAAGLLALVGCALAAAWDGESAWWAIAVLAAFYVACGLVAYALARLAARLLIAPLIELLPRQFAIHGSARWQRGREVVAGNLTRSGSIYLGGWRDWRGRLHALTSNGGEHVLVVGSSRSGKGTGVIVPTLLHWEHSAIVYDEKAELSRLTSGWRAAEGGNKVYRFEPASPNSGARLNPLDAIPLNSPMATGAAMNIAEILTEDAAGAADPHWHQTSKELLAGAILFTAFRERALGRSASLPDVAEALGNADLFTLMSQSTNPLIRGAGLAQKGRADREASSVLSSALRALAIFRDPVIAANVASSSFTLDELADGEQPATLYIVSSARDAHRLRPLVRLTFTTVLFAPDERRVAV